MSNSADVAAAAGELLRPDISGLPDTHDLALARPRLAQLQDFGREADRQVEEVLSVILRVLRPG